MSASEASRGQLRLAGTQRANGASCGRRRIGSTSLVVCEFDPRRVTFRYLWRDSAGRPYATISSVRRALQSASAQPLLVANAGIFDTVHSDGTQPPLGLAMDRGRVLSAFNPVTTGFGNFYLAPGVFFVDDSGRAHVRTTSEYTREQITPRGTGVPARRPSFATQSGPLLARAGVINRAFAPTSRHLNAFRSAIGVRSDGAVVYVLAPSPTRMYELAVVMRDSLGCRDALYLDGAVSVAALGRSPAVGRDTSSTLVGFLAILPR